MLQMLVLIKNIHLLQFQLEKKTRIQNAALSIPVPKHLEVCILFMT